VLPPSEPVVASPPILGIQKVEPVKTVQPSLPDITPMRRGRPTTQAQLQPVSAKATPSTSRGASSDPFAALDSTNVTERSAAVDELAARFPSVDEFSLLHDRGMKFEFGQSGPVAADQSINKRVTEVLADEVFAQAGTNPTKMIPATSSASALSQSLPLRQPRAATGGFSQPPIAQPIPQRPSMVSTGIQTSPPPSPPKSSDFPIWRVPQKSGADYNKASLQTRQSSSPFEAELPPRPEKTNSRPSLLERHRTKSQTMTLAVPQSPASASSRPSLESSRPSALDLSDTISRSKSANARPRPASVYVESNMDYLRNREATPAKTSGSWLPKTDLLKSSSSALSDSSDDEGPEDPIASNVGFLRAMESDSVGKRKTSSSRRRSSSGGKSKRTSLPSISLSGTKNILAGRFGDAFRRFETNSSSQQPARVPSPEIDHDFLRSQALTPIAGSERTGTSGFSDDEMGLDESQQLSPEVRREMERRRLSQEERRVADAAAEYRKRLDQGDRGGGGSSKGSAIQNRVKELLDGSKEVQTTRTAEGYGRFTPAAKTGEKPVVARKPVAGRSTGYPAMGSLTGMAGAPNPGPPGLPAANRTGPRPNIAPKPQAFRTGGPSNEVPSGRTQQEDEDWEKNFEKKYPALGLDLVEADIRPSMRIRDV
jgi:AP2-associated kinase